MELKSSFSIASAHPAHENTILASAVLPEGMEAPFEHAWGYLAENGEMGRHSHPTEEVYFFFKGSGFVCIDGQEIPATVGDVIRVPAGSEHTVINRSSAELLWAALWWKKEQGKD